MAGRSKERFKERERRRDSRYKDFYDNRRSPNPYSSDEERDQDDSYNNSYRNHRRYNNERDSWHDRRSNRDKYRSRSRERNQKDKYNNSANDNYDNSFDTYNEKKKEETNPNNTIMIRNLGLQVIENEIMIKLAEVGLRPKEIRLMRKKDTGESRGFAFVEFNDVSEAIYWKNQSQGHVTFSDGQQASLHFSIPKDAFNADRNIQQKTDWTCYKCGVVNFKRRDVCFKCSTTREESALNETGDEISPVPTNCLLFRNLNPYTTEERILTILGTLTTLPIKSIKVPKENSISLCVCFVELYTTHEASQIFALLSTLTSGFIIDDFPITICYAKRNIPNSNGMNTNNLKNAATMALAAAQWTNQKDANSVAAVPSTKTSYKNSDQSQINNMNIHEALNVQIMIPFSAPVLNGGVDYGTVIFNNVTYKKYPTPDASTYQYEETSGYYYDSMTCLYYNPSNHYYYNGSTLKYLYWSNEHSTYLPIETIMQQTDTSKKTDNTNKKDELVSSFGSKEENKAKDDKVKTAKKIAKDMEKWAKSLNQKKEINKLNQVSSNNSDEASSPKAFESISLSGGFSLKDNKPKLIEKNPLFDNLNETEAANAESKKEEKPNNDLKLNLTDWNKLICLLCKRQFNSKEQLSKHQQASELHKTNLFKLTGCNFTQEQIAELSKNDGEFNFNYRDRAKERRLKYGQPDLPEPQKYKEKFLKQKSSNHEEILAKAEINPVTQSTSNPLQNSIGAKLLKQMGWNDGQGLGKSNQGRSSLIEVERRTAGVGLGIKSTVHPSGETYKEAVKRTMIERYKELHEKEMSQMNT